MSSALGTSCCTEGSALSLWATCYFIGSRSLGRDSLESRQLGWRRAWRPSRRSLKHSSVGTRGQSALHFPGWLNHPPNSARILRDASRPCQARKIRRGCNVGVSRPRSLATRAPDRVLTCLPTSSLLQLHRLHVRAAARAGTQCNEWTMKQVDVRPEKPRQFLVAAASELGVRVDRSNLRARPIGSATCSAKHFGVGSSLVFVPVSARVVRVAGTNVVTLK